MTKTYSLLTIHRTHADGTIDGAWLQDHTGNARSARNLANHTSAMNSNMPIAVVAGVSFCDPCDLHYNKKQVA